MRRKILILSKKIDDCCNPFFNSFGIDCVRCGSSLTKYLPWGIFLLVLGFFASATYLIWINFMPSCFNFDYLERYLSLS